MRCERIIYHHNVILCLQNEALLILEAFLSQELKLISAVNKIINVLLGFTMKKEVVIDPCSNNYCKVH